VGIGRARQVGGQSGLVQVQLHCLVAHRARVARPGRSRQPGWRTRRGQASLRMASMVRSSGSGRSPAMSRNAWTSAAGSLAARATRSMSASAAVVQVEQAVAEGEGHVAGAELEVLLGPVVPGQDAQRHVAVRVLGGVQVDDRGVDLAHRNPPTPHPPAARPARRNPSAARPPAARPGRRNRSCERVVSHRRERRPRSVTATDLRALVSATSSVHHTVGARRFGGPRLPTAHGAARARSRPTTGGVQPDGPSLVCATGGGSRRRRVPSSPTLSIRLRAAPPPDCRSPLSTAANDDGPVS
jgi:hypothetical protein